MSNKTKVYAVFALAFISIALVIAIFIVEPPKDSSESKTESSSLAISNEESQTPLPNENEADEVSQEIAEPIQIITIANIFLVLSSIAFLAVIFLLFKEIKWRRRRDNNESFVFVDTHLDVLEKVIKTAGALQNTVNELKSQTLGFQKENISLSSETINSVSKFNSLIDAQKKEIDRLKEGYDYSIKKHSIKALIEIQSLLDRDLKELLSEETKDKLVRVQDYVQSYLEELDVRILKFEAGQFIRDLSGDEFEIKEIIIPSDTHLAGQVVETLEVGYEFIHPDGKNVVKKAKLKAYKLQDK
jgi:hypothetical protein